jgi:hypothetical protein
MLQLPRSAGKHVRSVLAGALPAAHPEDDDADGPLDPRPGVTMNAPRTLVGLSLTFATLSVLAGCASSGQRASTGAGETAQTAAAQAGAAAPRRGNSFVLTGAEIASASVVTNAYDAVEALRPHFLRTRGSTSRPGGLVGAGAGAQASGRRSGQGPGSQTGGSQAGGRAEDNSAAARTVEDPGILVYLDRQRYGGMQTLREIPIATVEEIRFLNVGEANSLFGMGHPHGVIQIITRRGPSSP